MVLKMRGKRWGEIRISGPEFVELMERYGIKPSHFKYVRGKGLSSRYMNYLRKGDRNPSPELVKQLLELIKLKTGKEISLGGPVAQPGRAPPSHGGGPGFKSRPVHHLNLSNS